MGWNIKNKTWKKWGKLTARQEFGISKKFMKKGIDELKTGKRVGITKLEQQGASHVHLAKIHYANAKKKSAYGRTQGKISAGMNMF